MIVPKTISIQLTRYFSSAFINSHFSPSSNLPRFIHLGVCSPQPPSSKLPSEKLFPLKRRIQLIPVGIIYFHQIRNTNRVSVYASPTILFLCAMLMLTLITFYDYLTWTLILLEIWAWLIDYLLHHLLMLTQEESIMVDTTWLVWGLGMTKRGWMNFT